MNSRKNSILIFLVVFLLITNIAMLLYFTVFNGMPRQNHGDKKGPGITAFLQNEAGFSKEQMNRLDSLKKQHRELIKPLFDELGKSKDHFYQLLGKPGISDTALDAAASAIGRNQAALDLQFFKNFTSIRDLCTPGQLIKFDAAMPSMASKMMQPWQKNYPPRKKDTTDPKN